MFSLISVSSTERCTVCVSGRTPAVSAVAQVWSGDDATSCGFSLVAEVSGSQRKVKRLIIETRTPVQAYEYIDSVELIGSQCSPFSPPPSPRPPPAAPAPPPAPSGPQRWQSLGPDAACRTKGGDEGSYKLIEGVTAAVCRSRCAERPDCLAYELRAAGDCEIHFDPIEWSAAKSGFSCFLKVIDPPSALLPPPLPPSTAQLCTARASRTNLRLSGRWCYHLNGRPSACEGAFVIKASKLSALCIYRAAEAHCTSGDDFSCAEE